MIDAFGQKRIQKFGESEMRHIVRWDFRRRDWRTSCLVIVMVVFCAAMYWEHLRLYARGQVDVRDDLGAFHLPMLISVTESMKNSVSFNWIDRYFGGFSLIGEGQIATTHPVRMAAYRYLDFDLIYTLDTILPVMLIQCGLYHFLRTQKLSGAVSLYGAFIFAFSGLIAARWFHVNYLYAFGHSIWSMCVCFWYVMSTGRRLRFVFLLFIALIKSSQVMMGGPPYFIYGNMIEISYLSFLAICGSCEPVRLWFVFGAFLIGGMLGAPQLHAQFVEMSTNISDKKIQDFSLSRLRDIPMVFQPFNPFVALKNHEYMFSVCGSATLCSVACGIASQRRTPVMRWCIVVFGLSAFVCFLGFSPLLSAIYERFPIIGQLRIHQRYGVIAAFVMVVFHCHVIQAMIDEKEDSCRIIEERRKYLKIGATFVLLSAVVPVGILMFDTSSAFFTSLQTPEIAAALVEYNPLIWQLLGVDFVILTILVLISDKSNSSKAMLFMLLSIIEATTYSRGFARPVPFDLQLVDRYRMRNVRPEMQRIAFLKGNPDDPHSWELMKGNPLVIRSDTVNGYKARDPKFGIRTKSIEDLRLAAVDRIVFSNERMTYFDELRSIFLNYRKASPPVFEMVTITDPLPRFRLIPESAVLKCQDAHGETMEPISLESESRLGINTTPTPGRIDSLRIENDFKSFRLKCDMSSVMLIADSWHPDWKAILDGKIAAVERFHGALQAIRIPQGNHNLSLTFQPANYHLDRSIMATGGVLMVLLIYAESRLI